MWVRFFLVSFLIDDDRLIDDRGRQGPGLVLVLVLGLGLVLVLGWGQGGDDWSARSRPKYIVLADDPLRVHPASGPIYIFFKHLNINI